MRNTPPAPPTRMASGPVPGLGTYSTDRRLVSARLPVTSTQVVAALVVRYTRELSTATTVVKLAGLILTSVTVPAGAPPGPAGRAVVAPRFPAAVRPSTWLPEPTNRASGLGMPFCEAP